MVWVTALSRSGFWADDFLNVTRYARSLGDLSYSRNQGKYVINVFWAIGTLAFGAGSAVPFIMLNTLVFVTGVVTWLWVGTRTRWSALDAWWIGGLFIATAAWLLTSLWSSNIVHSVGFLALGIGLLAHERCMRARTIRDCTLWSLAGGAAWTLAVVSNLIYLGLLVIAAYCAFHQVLKIRQLGIATTRAGSMVGSWNLVVPLAYFLAIAYPATTASAPYANNGLKFVRLNLHFYREGLAPTNALVVVYVVALVLGVVGGAIAVRRRDWFPIAVLGAAGATAVPALVQAQQRDIHYMAMPLLLIFSAVAAGARPVLLGRSKQLVQFRRALFVGMVAALLLMFQQGADVRSFFVQSPLGGRLAAFRSEVASLTPESGTICAKLDLDAQHEGLFIAEMSGENGFRVPPINAVQVDLISAGQACPMQGAAANITVSLDARGDFVASS